MILKALVGASWLLAILWVAVPTLPGARLGVPLLAILAGVHALECLVFLPRLRAAGGSLGNHLLQTFLFGFAHVRTTPAPGQAAS